MTPHASLERLELETDLLADQPKREKGPSDRLEGAILICKELPAHARQASQDLWKLLKAKQVDDLQEGGERFLFALDLAIQVAEIYACNTAMPLGDVRADLKQIRQEHLDRWPWFKQEDLDQAAAEAARGETVDMEDAFAAIAGVSREEWDGRVEAYQRQKDKSDGT
jgi:hypothetical protein